ncbi:MAG: flagellar hook protein FlgE [Bdellovibrionales bacterium]|nr:flagellar hook protein FlgE [Bdellovibrionales bacterium]
MRLFSSLRTGREALVANGTAIATVANNLTNANTTAYKAERAEFSDLLGEAAGGMYQGYESPGDGAQVALLTTNFANGAFEDTGRGLDWAVDGNGFFIARDANNDIYYTRAGNFRTDPDGNIVTPTGYNVMGYTAESPDELVPLNIANVAAAAEPTSTASFFGNLNTGDALGTAPANPADFQTIADASQFSTSITAIDSLGEEHTIALHFFHTGNLTYDVQAYVDGGEVGATEGTPVLLGGTTITFEGNGIQPAGAAISFDATPAWSNGATAGAINFDFSSMSGFSVSSALSNVSVDGIVPGNVINFVASADGSVNARLDNGELVSVGTVALADFLDKQGLRRIGDNLFVQDFGSGEPIVGTPSTEGRGTILGEALELSNVDTATEFVNLIRYQRAYQAGSSTISTSSELLNTTIQLA